MLTSLIYLQFGCKYRSVPVIFVVTKALLRNKSLLEVLIPSILGHCKLRTLRELVLTHKLLTTFYARCRRLIKPACRKKIIHLRCMMSRMHKLLVKLPVIGEQKQSLRILVKPADRKQFIGKLLREILHNRLLTCIASCRYTASRLIHHVIQLILKHKKHQSFNHYA